MAATYPYSAGIARNLRHENTLSAVYSRPTPVPRDNNGVRFAVGLAVYLLGVNLTSIQKGLNGPVSVDAILDNVTSTESD